MLLCWLSAFSTFPDSGQHVWRGSTGGNEEQDGWYSPRPPNHTFTVTMGWPQLTPWPLNSLTSHWLGLNRVFAYRVLWQRKRSCFTVTVNNAAVLKCSTVQRNTQYVCALFEMLTFEVTLSWTARRKSLIPVQHSPPPFSFITTCWQKR